MTRDRGNIIGGCLLVMFVVGSFFWLVSLVMADGNGFFASCGLVIAGFIILLSFLTAIGTIGG